MKEDRDSFIEDLADNTPTEAQFDKLKEAEVHDAEEDLVAGKTYKKLKDEVKRGKK
jgi:hypothetical protein